LAAPVFKPVLNTNVAERETRVAVGIEAEAGAEVEAEAGAEVKIAVVQMAARQMKRNCLRERAEAAKVRRIRGRTEEKPPLLAPTDPTRGASRRAEVRARLLDLRGVSRLLARLGSTCPPLHSRTGKRRRAKKVDEGASAGGSVRRRRRRRGGRAIVTAGKMGRRASDNQHGRHGTSIVTMTTMAS
jgi:hypothetical protein